MSDRAADVVFARDMLVWGGRDRWDEFRDVLRRRIAGLSSEQADAALVDLFREVDVLDDVIMEEAGFRTLTPEEIEDMKRDWEQGPPF